MPVVARDDPYAVYNFQVTIEGVSADAKSAKGSFSEITGLDMEVAAIDYRTGSEDIVVRKLPGLKKFPNLVLKRGIIGDLALWNWILKFARGEATKDDRRTGHIELLDENHQTVMTWTFQRALPVKFAGPQMNATKNEVALESLDIAHEGLYIDV